MLQFAFCFGLPFSRRCEGISAATQDPLSCLAASFTEAIFWGDALLIVAPILLSDCINFSIFVLFCLVSLKLFAVLLVPPFPGKPH